MHLRFIQAYCAYHQFIPFYRLVFHRMAEPQLVHLFLTLGDIWSASGFQPIPLSAPAYPIKDGSTISSHQPSPVPSIMLSSHYIAVHCRRCSQRAGVQVH